MEGEMLPSLSVWNTSPCCGYHGTVCRVSPGFMGGGSLELTIRCDLCGSEWTEGFEIVACPTRDARGSLARRAA